MKDSLTILTLLLFGATVIMSQSPFLSQQTGQYYEIDLNEPNDSLNNVLNFIKQNYKEQCNIETNDLYLDNILGVFQQNVVGHNYHVVYDAQNRPDKVLSVFVYESRPDHENNDKVTYKINKCE